MLKVFLIITYEAIFPYFLKSFQVVAVSKSQANQVSNELRTCSFFFVLYMYNNKHVCMYVCIREQVALAERVLENASDCTLKIISILC